MRTTLACVVAVVLVWTSHAVAADGPWPNWRGPAFNGSAAADADPPAEIDPDDLTWSTDLPGPGASTPAVAHGHVYLTSFDRPSGQVLALAFDLKTGRELWRHSLGKGRDARDRGRENFLAACSPAADAERVVFMAGNGTVAAFAPDGTEQWRRDLQKQLGQFKIIFGYAASPLLHDGTVYVSVLHRADESYLLGLDAKTGEDRFKVTRPTIARSESKEAYTTPTPATIFGQAMILVYGGDALTGHDPKTGAERFRWEGDMNPAGRPNYRAVSGPVPGGDGVVFVNAPRGNPVYRLDIAAGKTEVAWEYDRFGGDVPVPALGGGKLYVMAGGKKTLSRLDPATGKPDWRHEFDVPTYFRASPTYAAGRVYAINAQGTLFVLDVSGDAPRQVARAELGGYPAHAAPVVAGSQLIVRTGTRVLCVSR